MTNWGCNWCLNENVCMFNTSKCDKSYQTSNTLSGGPGQRFDLAANPIIVGAGLTRNQAGLIAAGSRSGGSSNTISLVQQCPTFDVGHQQDIVIADGSERELSIRVKNMPQFKVSLYQNSS